MVSKNRETSAHDWRQSEEVKVMTVGMDQREYHWVAFDWVF